jgi:hypothetical protein
VHFVGEINLSTLTLTQPAVYRRFHKVLSIVGEAATRILTEFKRNWPDDKARTSQSRKRLGYFFTTS